ncbi:hypothetical protein KSS87_004910 [Heliosperma pusillum]|nr:hypothetical protein KSS87_004910 [Heliosperma pusillum]
MISVGCGGWREEVREESIVTFIYHCPKVVYAPSTTHGLSGTRPPGLHNGCKLRIILGSKSIARRKIMEEMGYKFTIMTADIDEKAIRKEKPEDLVMALAEAKLVNAIRGVVEAIRLHAFNPLNSLRQCGIVLSFTTCFSVFATLSMADAIISKLQIADKQVNDHEPTLLLSADTVVVYEGMVREKPSSKEEARQFMKDYSGKKASTLSSVLVTNLRTGFRKGEWDKVEILFHVIPEEVIDNLIEEGDVLHVAGGLIIEHPLILPLVKEVVGTTDSVMGLPKAVTKRLIEESL